MPFLGWNRRLRDFSLAQKHQRNAHPKGGCAGCDAPRPRKGNNQSATSGRTTDRGQALCAAPTPASRWVRMALGPARSISRLCSIDTPEHALRRPQGRGLRGAKRAQLDPGQGRGLPVRAQRSSHILSPPRARGSSAAGDSTAFPSLTLLPTP